MTKTLNRRKFLANTTASALAFQTIFKLTAADRPASSSKIRIGFLGASYSHAEAKLKLLLRSADYHVVGACEKEPNGLKLCNSLGVKLFSQEELLDQCEVIAVESAVRDHAHHALAALSAGKHVHLEKPPAKNLTDMQQLVTLAREKKRLLQTGYMWRYNPGFKSLIEAAHNGWLGQLFMVQATIPKDLSPERRKQWAEFEGGPLFEIGSHLVDAIVRVLGQPQSVTPFLRHHGAYKDSLKDNAIAVFEFQKAFAILTCNSLQGTDSPPRSFEIVGTKGSAKISPFEPPVLKIDLSQAEGPYKRGATTVELPDYKPYEGDFAELAAAVRGEKALSVSLEEELMVHQTLLRASGVL